MRSILVALLLLLLPVTASAQLAVSVEVGPDPVRDGFGATTEITVANAGAAPIANVTLEVDLPANVGGLNQNLTTFGGTCTGSGNLNTTCEAGETVTWGIGTLPAGGRKTVTVSPIILTGVFEPPDGTLFAFDARARESGIVTASASESTSKLRVPVYELYVDEAADPVAANATLTYTLVYGKQTAGDGLGAALSFTLPAGTTFVSASDGGVFGAGVVSWNLGTVAGGLGGTRQVTVQVQNLVDGTLLRGVAGIQDLVAASARAQAVTAVQSDSPLELAIEVHADATFGASVVDVELTATNTSAGVVDPVLELRLDDSLAAFSQNLTRGGVCTISGNLNTTCDTAERIQWDLPPLGPGERATVTLPPQILGGVFEPFDGTLIPIRAELFQPLGGTIGESRLVRHSLRKSSQPGFEVAVSESADPVAPGAQLVYTLAYGRSTSGAGTGTTLTFELPPQTSFVSASDGGTHSSGVVSWNLGDVALGQSGVRQVFVDVSGAASEGAILHSLARVRDGATTPRVARAANAAVVQSGSPLLLAVEAGPDPIRVIEAADIELTVANVGGSTLSPVLELRLDQSLAGFAQNLATHGADCTVSGNANTTCDVRERIRWVLQPLGPGERISVTIPPQVIGGVGEFPDGTLIPVRAEVFEELVGATGESRVASFVLRKQNARNLELALDESDDPVAPDADLTYTISYGKPTAGSAAGAMLQFPIPRGTSFVSASDGGVFASGVVTWSLGSLPAGEGGTREVTVHVDTPVVQGSVIEASARLADGATSLARAEASSVVRASSPFALAIESIPDPAVTQEAADTQITVVNTSGTTLDAVLDLRLDDALVGFAETFPMGDADCGVSGNVNVTCDVRELVRWNLASLAPGERRTVTLAPQLPGGVFETADGTLIPLRAEVYVPEVGSTGERRIERRMIRKRNTRTFELLVDDSSDPVAPGANLTYTLHFGHPSAGTSGGAVLSFPLPAGTSFVSASNGGAFSNGVVSWPIPALPTGQGGSRQVTVQVGAGLATGTLLETVARLQNGLTPDLNARAPVVTAVESAPPLRVSITATPSPAQPATVLDVDLLVENLSGAPIAGAVLESRVPDTVAAFAQANATPAADCTVSGNGNTTCDLRERVRWALPVIAAGGSTSVSIPPQVLAGVFSPPNGTLIRFLARVEGSQSLATQTVRIGFVDSDGDGVVDGVDNCGAVANAGQADGEGDGVGDVCDVCPTFVDFSQSDVDADLVGDVCDNCVALANPRVSATYLTTNPWATLTGGQRDDDHDGYGNRCDAKFPGSAGALVGAPDVAQFRASNGKNRTLDVCGNTGTRPCAIFDMDDAATLIGAGDLAIVRALNGKLPGPKCAACPLVCTAGASGTCF